MNKPVSPLQGGQLRRSAGKRSVLISPRGGVHGFNELIVDGLVDDGYDTPPELVAQSGQPLQTRVPWWDEIEEYFVITLIWNGINLLDADGVSYEVELDDELNPDFECPLEVPVRYLDQVVEGTDQTFELGFAVRQGFGDNWDYSATRRIRVDKLSPGGNAGSMAKLEFPAEIEARGRILVTDFDASGELRIEAKGYVAQERGDKIVVTMSDGTTTETAGPFEVLSSKDSTILPLPLAKLQALVDEKPITFTYQSTDRASNVSIVSVAHNSLSLLLRDIPPVLDTPMVPGFDQDTDPLVLDEDARAGIKVVIPPVTGVRPGDRIVVLWGAQRSEEHEVDVVPTPPNPLMEIMLLYPLTSQGSVQGNVSVSYELWRSGSRIGTSAGSATVKVDLRLPGGPDPDPELPWHGNLVKASIVGDDSGQANNLTPEDVAAGATLTIPWKAADGTNDVLAEGDELQLVWGTRSFVLDPVTDVEAAAAVPVTRKVLPAWLATEPSGDVQMAYAVTREFGAGGEANTALSPSESVKVVRGLDLPGQDGALIPLKFTYLNSSDAIDKDIAERDLPIRIWLYSNAQKDDQLVVHLAANDRQRPPPGNPIPEAQWDLPLIRIEQHHLDARDSKDPDDPGFGFVELSIERRWAFIVCTGSATVEYTATNKHGDKRSGHIPVPVAVKLPSEPTCPLS
ncbi:hypothetical protein [Pseudomonas sp. TE50-2]|uniref:hypothetical protein n=1 Tax=Pseudomonas sp. TE50-2 TaxID=3142707 RepID=UPI0034674DE0